MNYRRAALALLVVGVLLLPAPLYLPAAAEATAPPPKSPQVYAAEPVDLNNGSDRERLVDRHWTSVAFSAHQVSQRYSHDEYRAPNESRAALREAMRTGSATVDSAGAKADLRELGGQYRFLTDRYTDIEGYYRFDVRENGSVVEAENVSRERVADAIAQQAPHYENLSAGEQHTLDRLLDNSTDENWGYRTRVDEPFADRLPTAFWKGDTLYSVSVTGHVDDFGPGFAAFFAGLAVAALGFVLVLLGGGYLLVRRSRG
jgi:hypothetical protein